MDHTRPLGTMSIRIAELGSFKTFMHMSSGNDSHWSNLSAMLYFWTNMQHQHPFINFQRQGVSKQSGTLQHCIPLHHSEPEQHQEVTSPKRYLPCVTWGFHKCWGMSTFQLRTKPSVSFRGYPRNVINCYKNGNHPTWWPGLTLELMCMWFNTV